MFPQVQTVDYYVQTPAQSVGQMVISTSPIVAAARTLNQRKLVSGVSGGFGDQNSWALLGLIAVGVVAATGALCYQAGKAMAPNKGERKTWGWVGVPVGLLGGPIGLGVMGVISNSQRKG